MYTTLCCAPEIPVLFSALVLLRNILVILLEHENTVQTLVIAYGRSPPEGEA